MNLINIQIKMMKEDKAVINYNFYFTNLYKNVYKCIHFKIVTKTHDAGNYHKVHLTLSQKYFNKFQIF